jgi:predicted SAM-dependent methyltransferase
MKLHIGGQVRQDGWTNLDIEARPEVDIVANCVSMPMIGSNDAECVYASHVLEHLNYNTELPVALAEICRVLTPGGTLMLSVPDLQTLCWLFGMPHFGARERYHIMDTMFGGGEHRAGLTEENLSPVLAKAGFQDIRRVERFGQFQDFSDFKIFGLRISLNMVASKPA